MANYKKVVYTTITILDDISIPNLICNPRTLLKYSKLYLQISVKVVITALIFLAG